MFTGSKALFSAWTIVVATCTPAVAQAQAGDYTSSRKPSLGIRGTATMFLKRLEIMDRDSYGRDSRPLPPDQAVRKLSRYDAIGMATLIPTNNRGAWRLLRREHPEVLAFHYVSSVSARRQSAGLSYFNYGEIRPKWYLLDDTRDPARADLKVPANRIRWSTTDRKSPNYDRFYLDVGNTEFQRWAAKQAVAFVSGKAQGLEHSYDGLVMDNVSIGSRRMVRIDHYHPGWKYAGNHRAWNEAFFAYLKTVKSALNEHGYLLVVNHTLNYGSDVDDQYWKEFLPCIDGAMTEKALGDGLHRYEAPVWLKSLERHEQVIQSGIIDWWVYYPPTKEPDGHRDFLYGYCSWLLVRKPGLSLFQATRGDPGYANPRAPWYEEFDLRIGLPTSNRYQREKCWFRDYGEARVVVNPTRTEQWVSFNDSVERTEPSTGRSGFRFSIPRFSGRILLPVP